MGRLWAWLRAHPMVWLIPLAFWIALAAFVVWKMSDAPRTEFIYQL